jgi:peptidoglycan/LPS O-acetylase OafA/YrhL
MIACRLGWKSEMLRKPETSDRPGTATGRIVALDRARTLITLLVLIHHAAVNYTHFGNGDKMRWLGFDLVVLFNDSFFMACMFLISGLFVPAGEPRATCGIARGDSAFPF